MFVGIDQNITSQLLTQFVGDVLKSSVLATLDNAVIQSNSAHLISPYMKGKTILSAGKTTSFDAQTKEFIDSRLASISIIGQSGGKAEVIKPKSIDVGSAATDRSTSSTADISIDGNNPANADGSIDTCEVWLATSETGSAVIGNSYVVSGNVHTSRDHEAVGAISGGAKRTLVGLTITIVTGDYIGIQLSDGAVDRDSTGGTIVWIYTGGSFPYSNRTFGTYGGDILSLYGTGSEPPAGWAHKLNGIAPAKVNGLAVGSIAKINGV